MFQVQWVSWMKYAQEVVITPETSYSDIIVPTVNTVRMSFLIDMLLSNKKPVCVYAPIIQISLSIESTLYIHLRSFIRCCALGPLAQERL